MKYSVLTTVIALLLVSGASAQKIKLSKSDKDKYVEQQKESDDGDRTMAVYQVMNLQFGENNDKLSISLDRGSGELPSKSSVMVFPELEKLERLNLTPKAEVDLLNYLAENGWEVIAIETVLDRKTTERRVYLRKYIKS